MRRGTWAALLIGFALAIAGSPAGARSPAAPTVATTLTDVAFTSPEVGYAVGRVCSSPGRCSGLVLTTHDGGTAWRAHYLPTHGLVGVSALKPSLAWVWSPQGLWATADGGRRWTRRAWKPWAWNLYLSASVSFANPRDGWLLESGWDCASQGCGASLFATGDGGDHWRLIADNPWPPGARHPRPPDNLPWAEYSSSQALGDGRGLLFITSALGGVFRTVDGGLHWSQRSFYVNGYSAAFTSSGRGWVVGSQCFPKACSGPKRAYPVYATDDGGRHWNLADWVPASAPWVGIPFELSAEADGTGAWVAVNGNLSSRLAAVGQLARRTPLRRLPKAWALGSLSAVTAQLAWGVVSTPQGDVLAITSDGGRTWQVRWR